MSKIFYLILFLVFSFSPSIQSQEFDELTPKDQEKIRQKVEAMKEAGLIDKNLDLNNPEDIQKAQKQIQQNMNKLMGEDGKLKMDPKNIKKMMKISTAVFRNKTEADVMKEIKDRFEPGSFINSFLNNNPRILLFIARVLRDSHALPRLSEIITKKVMLSMYGGFVLVTFIFGFAWSRWDSKSGSGIFQGLFRMVLRFGTINAFRLFFFYYLFKKEAKPTWNIFKEIFLNF